MKTYDLTMLLSKSEIIKFEEKLGLKSLTENKVYIKPAFFKKDLFKIKSILSKNNFKNFIQILKEDSEIIYTKLS